VKGSYEGTVYKGWTRVGGAGWVVIRKDEASSLTKRNLEDCKRYIADRLNRKEKASASQNTREREGNAPRVGKSIKDNQHLIDIWPGKYTRTHERAEELLEQTLKRESDLSHALECIRAQRDELRESRNKLLELRERDTLEYSELDSKRQDLAHELECVRKQLNATFLQLSEAEQERDELLAALKDLLSEVKHYQATGSKQYLKGAIDDSQAAIAKAKGRAE
jgi:chromosome segregation ATPase